MVESEVEEGWSKAQHHDSGGAEMEEALGGTAHGHVFAEAEDRWPDQAFMDFGLPLASKSKLDKDQSAETTLDYPCRPTPASSLAALILWRPPTCRIHTCHKSREW